jgi:hypothetical protein
LWAECTLQTYFVGKGRIDFFIVVVDKKEDNSSGGNGQGPMPLTEPQKASLEEIEKDFGGVKDDIAKQTGIVQGFEDSRSVRVPWLEKTAFPSHLASPTDDEIKG